MGLGKLSPRVLRMLADMITNNSYQSFLKSHGIRTCQVIRKGQIFCPITNIEKKNKRSEKLQTIIFTSVPRKTKEVLREGPLRSMKDEKVTGRS